jgi:glyoxylase-like metal-dependent hydrolase (beta-lactamase superfamily II)
VKLHFLGGFSEKGRTCVGVESEAASILLDVGINTSASGGEYYPAISEAALAKTDAILITHAHEDHIGGLGWCASNGFKGRVLMTAETRAEMDACLADYAQPEDRAKAAGLAIETFPPGKTLRLGDLTVETGRSGHAVGGVWFRVRQRNSPSLLYCGDTVPHSIVLAMDEPPKSEILVFDASYGDDPVSRAQRVRDIQQWVADAGDACLLPTPLIGRSLELLAALGPAVAIHRGMRDALAQQIGNASWLRRQMPERLRAVLNGAIDWSEKDPFPSAPLLTDDGMGIAGPSALAIPRAIAEGVPMLMTGHLPKNSLAEVAVKQGKADWIRLPTHPTWPESLELIRLCEPRVAIGHSCDESMLKRLLRAGPDMLCAVATGDVLDAREWSHAHSGL